MVDVGSKSASMREAVACGAITMSRRAYDAVRSGSLEKGDLEALARVAGIAAAKRTAEWIPLCHTIPLDHVAVEIRFSDDDHHVEVETRARARWGTGVEMEALVAATAALLTVYDMAKSMDRGMVLGPIRLLRKSGGRSGDYVAR
jgi:cyclic pyranopterin phosphate synthase